MKFQLLIKPKMLKIRNYLAFNFSDVVLIMLINIKRPIIVDILTFMSMIHLMLSRVEHDKSVVTPGWVLAFYKFYCNYNSKLNRKKEYSAIHFYCIFSLPQYLNSLET